MSANSGNFMTPPPVGPVRRYALIKIKAARRPIPRLSAPFEPGEPLTMPTDTAIVITGIVIVFAMFAVALAWADFYTNRATPPGDAH